MKKYSILIVDDDEVDRYTIKRLLKSSGIDDEALIEEVEDGETAIQFFRECDSNVTRLEGVFPPLIVFLDINMPRMDGFEFLDEFQQLVDQSNRYSSVIFLMLTSSENAKDKERADGYDCVKRYITKTSSNSAELLDQIRQFLPQDSATATPFNI